MTYEEILLSIRNKIDLWNNVCIAEDELNDVNESLNSGESYDFYHGKVEEHVNNARTILDDVAFFLIEDIKEDIRKAAKQFEE